MSLEPPVAPSPPANRFWTRLAERYDRESDQVVGAALRRSLRARLEQEGPLGDALELGCGPGYFTRALLGQASSVLASDLSEAMLDAARRALGAAAHLTFARLDCTRLPLADGRFDTVLVANTLNAVPDPAATLTESFRVLRPGGRLFVLNYTYVGLGPWARAAYVWRFLRAYGLPREPVRALTLAGLSEQVSRAGFGVLRADVVQEETPALYLVARKPGGLA